jgi:hypothetical protein
MALYINKQNVWGSHLVVKLEIVDKLSLQLWPFRFIMIYTLGYRSYMSIYNC